MGHIWLSLVGVAVAVLIIAAIVWLFRAVAGRLERR
jgi:hypothetical protein